jgi:MFS transporter, MHS family, shikimate and dehydroshikimate transport protein
MVLSWPAPLIAVGLVSLGTGSPRLLAVAMIVVGFFPWVAVPESRGIDLSPEPSESAEAQS